MSDRIFADKSVKPNNKLLQEALGKSYDYWVEIKNSLEKQYGSLTEEWKYYGQKLGWALKYFYKKRNLFFFAAYPDYFVIAFTFGDKACAMIENSDLPEALINELKNARKYAEGRGLRIEVKKSKEIKIIRKLVEFKINS